MSRSLSESLGPIPASIKMLASGVRTSMQFVAITDPGRPLDKLATETGFRRTFLNPAPVNSTHFGWAVALIVATVAAGAESAAAPDLPELIQAIPAGRTVLVDLYVTSLTAEEDGSGAPDARADRIRGKLGPIPPAVDRVAVAVRRPDGDGGGWPDWFTFRGGPDGQAVEDRTHRGWHPLVAERLGVWRFSGFELTRLPADPDVHLFRIQGCENRDDQRLMALADVRELTIVRDDAGRITGLPQLERILDACLDSLRSARSADRGLARLDWNRIMLYVWPTVEAPLTELGPVIRSLAARTGALGLEQVMVQFRDAEGRERMLRMSRQPGAGLTLRVTDLPPGPLRELNAYTQNVIRARRRGAVYPYELIPLITRSPDPGGADGEFTEYDLDEGGAPVPVDRAPGSNVANLVLGVVSTPTKRYPEGMRRVVLLGRRGEVLTIPIGHMEGNYFCDAATLDELRRRWKDPARGWVARATFINK